MIVPVASAISVSETIANGTVSGFNMVLRSITDQLYEINGLNSTYAMTKMSNAMVQPNDFLSNEFVQSEKDVTAFWFEIFYVIFLLAGGILLFKEEETKDSFGLEGDSWRNRYFTIAVVAPLIWAFYLIGFKWIFSLEYLLSKSMFIELTDFLPFDSENALAYFFMGIMMLINIVFLNLRYMAVGLIAGWFLFIIIAWFIPITKIYGKLIINYGLLMLFSRFVVILIFLGGFGITKGFGVGGVNLTAVPFFIVLLLAVLFELACIFYPLIYVFAHSPVKYIKIK